MGKYSVRDDRIGPTEGRDDNEIKNGIFHRIARPWNCNWASEASPTLGCSIEISRDIGYRTLYVGLSRIVRNLIQSLWDKTTPF